jgi:hypothetical protein
MRLLKTWLTKVEQARGKDSMEVAKLLDALGQGCKEQENFDDAKQYLSRSLSIKRRRLGSHHPEVATAIHRLAFCLDYTESAERAKLLAEAHMIEKKAGKLNPFDQLVLNSDQLKQAAEFSKPDQA